MVRYADDSIIGFQHEEEAERFLEAMRERLAKFGLTLHPQKTRLIEFGRYAEQRRKKRGLGRPETFDFLGFTHCCSKTRQGGFKILRQTVKKRLRATLAAIRAKLKLKRHEPIGQVGAWLAKVMRGYFNYQSCRSGQPEKVGWFPARGMPSVAGTVAPTQPERQDDMGAVWLSGKEILAVPASGASLPEREVRVMTRGKSLVR